MTIRVYLISEDIQFDDLSFPLDQAPVVIGRSVRADVQIVHPLISRLHCEWQLSGREVILRDKGSTNQTIVNGEPISQAALQAGDRLQLGDVVFVVGFAEESAHAAIETAPKRSEAESEMPTTRLTSSVISVVDAE